MPTVPFLTSFGNFTIAAKSEASLAKALDESRDVRDLFFSSPPPAYT